MNEWIIRIWAYRYAMLMGGLGVLVITALGGALVPVVVGFLLAYGVSPLVGLLTKRGISRGVAVWVVFGGVMTMIGLLIGIGVPLLLGQIQSVLRVLPNWIHEHYHVIRDTCRELGIPMATTETGFVRDLYRTLTRSLNQSFDQAVGSIGHVGGSVLQTTVWVINFALFPIFFFHFLHRLPRLYELLFAWTPSHFHTRLTNGLSELNTIIGGYIRGQLLVCTILGGLYAMGLWVMGVPGGVAIGIMTGYLNIVPYFGFSLGVIISCATAFIAGFSLLEVGMVLGILVACQLIESFILTPKLVGHSMGLDPLVVIIALMVGGNIWGMTGMVVAIPVAAILVGFIRHGGKKA